MTKIEIIAIKDFPIINKKENLPEIVYQSLLNNKIILQENDVLVLAETVVSKAEGNIISIEDTKITREAQELSQKSGKNPKECQIILDHTSKIIKCREGLIITQTPHGFICANSGIDNSNCQEGYVTPLPDNPDKSAQEIKKYLDKKFKTNSKIIISDTQGRAWRRGAIGVAVGISGMHPLTDFRGNKDLYGRKLQSTTEATADELASAASLLMGQADNATCLVLIRGYDLTSISCRTDESEIKEIMFDEKQDAFR